MGKITFDIGQTTVSRQVSNAQAAKILQDFLELEEGPLSGTLDEQLGWTLDWLLSAIRQAHISAVRRREIAKVDAELQAKFSDWN